MGFELVQGVSAENCSEVHSAFYADENGISATLSAEIFCSVITDLVDELCEPVFFFVELPCSDDEEKSLRKSKKDPFHYNVYYLDNCTVPVAKAIMKRYGELLVNDGLCRFGFGSHKDDEEIYCMKYQVVSVYGDAKRFKRVFEKHDVPEEMGFKTLWDTFTNDTPGTSSAVEINGETVYDIVSNLKKEGLYLSDVVEE